MRLALFACLLPVTALAQDAGPPSFVDEGPRFAQGTADRVDIDAGRVTLHLWTDAQRRLDLDAGLNFLVSFEEPSVRHGSSVGWVTSSVGALSPGSPPRGWTLAGGRRRGGRGQPAYGLLRPRPRGAGGEWE